MKILREKPIIVWDKDEPDRRVDSKKNGLTILVSDDTERKGNVGIIKDKSVIDLTKAEYLFPTMKDIDKAEREYNRFI